MAQGGGGLGDPASGGDLAAGGALLGGGPTASSFAHGHHSLTRLATRRALAHGSLTQAQLGHVVARLHECLGRLTDEQRRVLSLRAGLGPRPALSRSQVARRLGLAVAQTRRIERGALRRLGALDGAGMCTPGAVGASPLTLLTGGLGASAPFRAASGAASAADQSRARFGVKGVSESGGGGGGLALPPPIGDGADWTLLILLALAAGLALLVRHEVRRHH